MSTGDLLDNLPKLLGNNSGWTSIPSRGAAILLVNVLINQLASLIYWIGMDFNLLTYGSVLKEGLHGGAVIPVIG